MTRRVVPKDFGNYPLFHSKQRQLHADTDTFGRQSPKHTTDIYDSGNPIMVPKTDSYGKPMTDSHAGIVSVTTPSKTNHNSPSRKTDSSKSNIYIAVGTVTFLVITAAVLLLIVWVMKRKNQRRVENADICET